MPYYRKMFRLQSVFIWAICFVGICMWSLGASYEYDGKDPVSDADAGAEWLYYVDDDGNTHLMNFSVLPTSREGFVCGDAYFSLYTRNNTFNPEMLSIPDNNTQFESDYFDASKPVFAITHGWFSDDKSKWLQDIKNSVLKKSDMNVITVDWSELSKNPFYHWSAMSTRYVGKKLAKLLDAIIKSCKSQGKDMYLVGHSLGAHVMGYAGMFSRDRIQRITGLDPARPLFEVPLMPPDFRLDESDAEFVDIIHTSSGVLGYKSSYGHADFFPNNGTVPQPGCVGILNDIQSCSHGRACLYFEESIGYESSGFVAYHCRNWEQEDAESECKKNTQLMGYPTSSNALGDYYLRTRNQSKFAILEGES